MRIRSIAVSAGAALIALCVAAAPGTTRAEAAPRTAEIRSDVASVAEAQGRLLDFNTQLQQQSLQTGYVASVDDPASAAVTVYLHGTQTLSPAARALAAREDLRVRVKAWPYSMAELTSAAHQALARTRSAGSASVSATAFDPSFAGVTVATPSGAGAPRARISARLGAELAGIPVRVQQTQVGTAASRDRDYSPYNGGDFMFAFTSNGSASYCTTGFAVRYQSHNYVTTAQHCRSTGFRTLDNDSFTFGGTKKYSTTGQVRMMTAAGGTIMWTGPWETGSARTVIGARTVSIGDQVCDSGANSGSHCGITVNSNALFDDGYSEENILVGSVKTGIAIIQGDSGGPVYVPVPHSSTKVYAVGMIQAFYGSDLNPHCGDVYNAGENACTRTVGFTPIAQTLAGLKATLVTGK